VRHGTLTLLWLLGASLLLVFPIRLWIRAAPPDLLARPTTPVDQTDGAAARQWIFLRKVRTVLPPGATYTVIAPTRDVEMNLFMMSLGLLPEAEGLPSSYHGVPTPKIGSRARYVLAYQSSLPPGAPLPRAVFTDGTVSERRSPPR
jgi:hypothetical protein